MTPASLPTIDAPSPASPELNSKVLKVLEGYLAELEGGVPPNPDELLARHPELAGPLREYLASLEFLHRAALSLHGSDQSRQVASEPTIAALGTLGDFRIRREIGRGGMGVVYEAEQISLGRRVALKVLPFAGALDAKQLQRFKNEAHAAAHLQHQNIVPVYFVGCERGVHFYAMQFVEGQTLAALIRELREETGLDERESRIEDRGSKAGGSVLDFLRTAPYTPEVEPPQKAEERERESKPTDSATRDQPVAAETLPAQPRSSIFDSRSSPFFRTVANLGIQAAEALEHAHQLGVIHRDIKPANLMVDARGNLWITDFGLAHCQGGVELTMSGDLLGTLRYMSPEQALAKRVIVDERTDIYSLSVTLYELLTLEPAFPGTDRQEVLRQIAFDDPKPPRRWNKAIPLELETIILKAMEKNPADRYAAAKELADDLQHFLDDKPIRARRPTLVQRFRKWARRHPGVIRTAIGAFLVAVLILVLSTLWIARAEKNERQARQDAQQAEREKTDKLWREKFARAQALRRSGSSGQRCESLKALAEAAQIARSLDVPEEDILKLRNEAIACMTFPDLQLKPEYDRYTGQLGGFLVSSGSLDAQVKRYAISDDQGNITIRSIPTDEEIVRLQSPGGRVQWLDFSPDGQFLAAIYPKQGHVLIWDLARAEIAWHLPTQFASTWWLNRGLWSPDGHLYAIFAESPRQGVWLHLSEGAIAIYDFGARRQIRYFPTSITRFQMAFHANGKQLAVLAKPGIVQIHDVETGQLVEQITFPAPAKHFAWGCNGRFLAAAYAEGDTIKGEEFHIYVWDVPAGRMHKVLQGHRATPLHVAFNHAGDLLASNGWDGTIRLWNPWSGKELLRTDGGWGTLEFRRDDRFLLAGNSWFPGLRCWEVTTGPEYRQLCSPAENTVGAIHDAEFNPDGRWLAARCADGVRLWDVATGKHVGRLSPGNTDSFNFDQDGGGIVTQGYFGHYRWPFSTDPIKRKLSIGPPEKMPFQSNTTKDVDRRFQSPDGKWTASSSGTSLFVSDTGSGGLARELPGTNTYVCFSPDSKCLLTDSGKEYVFWEIGSWAPRHTIPIPAVVEELRAYRHGRLPALRRFSQDGKLFALLDSWGKIQLVEPASGRVLAILSSPDTQRFNGFNFSRDSTHLAASTESKMIELWDLRAVRAQLKAIGLDWDSPPYPPATSVEALKTAQVQLEPGHMMDREKYSLMIGFFPFNVDAYYQRGLAYVRFGQFSEALADFTMAIVLQPDHVEALMQRALVQSNQGRFAEAVADFDKVIALQPGCSHALMQRGLVQARHGRVNEAYADLARVLADGHWRRGRISRESAVFFSNPCQQYKEAIDSLVRCLALAEQDPKLSQRQREDVARCFTNMAENLAEEAYERCPDQPSDLIALSWLLAICPDSRFRNPKLAVKLAQRADPFLQVDCIQLGIAHYRAGNWKAALEELNMAMISRNGGDCADWFFLAMTHCQLGHKAEARQWYDRATRLMETQYDETWPHFRAEAAALLGIQEEVPNVKAGIEAKAPSP